MTGFDDHAPEMPSAPHLDDATVAAILDGDRPGPALEHLAAFSAGVMAVGDGAPPRPSPELAALLTDGAPSAEAVIRTPRAQRSRSRRTSVLAKAAGLGLVAKVGVTTTAAAAGVIGAGAAGVLPGDADRVVRDAIEVVTPVEFTDSGDLDDGPGRGGPNRGEPAPTTDSAPTTDPGDPGSSGVPSVPGEHGDSVSPDATGGSDGEPGVDGPAVAEQAPGAEQRPAEPPGTSGGTPPSTVPPVAGGRGDTADASAPATTLAERDSPPSTNP